MDDEEGWRRLERVLEGMTVKVLEHRVAHASASTGYWLRRINYQQAEYGEVFSMMQEMKELLDSTKLPTLGKVLPEQSKHPKPL